MSIFHDTILTILTYLCSTLLILRYHAIHSCTQRACAWGDDDVTWGYALRAPPQAVTWHAFGVRVHAKAYRPSRRADDSRSGGAYGACHSDVKKAEGVRVFMRRRIGRPAGGGR